MAKDIISKKTRNEFREYFVGLTLREIELEFDAADVPCDGNYDPQMSGQRRSLVEQYYHAIDWTKWAHVRKVLTVYENVLSRLENMIIGDDPFSSNDYAKNNFKNLNKWLKKDGFEYKDGKLTPVGKRHGLEEITETTAKFDTPELHRQIERMKTAVEDDPSLAIGTAKELVETTCKTILEERGIEYEDNLDIIKLVKEARKSLGLVPENIPDSRKGADVIRRLLGNLGNIAQRLGELRNLYGTGHGKRGKAKDLSARHARLAIGSAATLATFLFETHKERNI